MLAHPLLCMMVVAFAGCYRAPVAPAPEPPKVAVVEPPAAPIGPPVGYVEMKVSQVVMSPQDGTGVVLLVDESEDRWLQIFIGGTEASSIELRLANASAQRPLTHDLLDNVMRRFGVSLVKVQVDELRNGTFIGSIYLAPPRRDATRRDPTGGSVRLDSRPSDAIALAIPTGAPIYVARVVLDDAAITGEQVKQQYPSPAP